jgi:hypothetical protein
MPAGVSFILYTDEILTINLCPDIDILPLPANLHGRYGVGVSLPNELSHKILRSMIQIRVDTTILLIGPLQ